MRTTTSKKASRKASAAKLAALHNSALINPSQPSEAPIAQLTNTAPTIIPAPVETKAETAAQAETKLTIARAERSLASKAVSAFYNGTSLPLKSASDKFADLRTDKAPKTATLRQSALLATLLLSDEANNIQSDGAFTRGNFVILARETDNGKFIACEPNDKQARPYRVQPESGCLSDGIGRLYSYVSGPLSGKAANSATFRINAAVAMHELALLPVALAAPAKARLSILCGVPVPKA